MSCQNAFNQVKGSQFMIRLGVISQKKCSFGSGLWRKMWILFRGKISEIEFGICLSESDSWFGCTSTVSSLLKSSSSKAVEADLALGYFLTLKLLSKKDD